jgi:fido (protein-threonine AMPylation protein)
MRRLGSVVDPAAVGASSIVPRSPNFPEEIAKVHRDFEAIHPFLDGNGRTGRLVLNLILVRMGYPPAIIYKNDRNKYLRALQRADAGDYGALGEFIAGAILDNLAACPQSARLVPLHGWLLDQTCERNSHRHRDRHRHA